MTFTLYLLCISLKALMSGNISPPGGAVTSLCSRHVSEEAVDVVVHALSTWKASETLRAAAVGRLQVAPFYVGTRRLLNLIVINL